MDQTAAVPEFNEIGPEDFPAEADAADAV